MGRGKRGGVRFGRRGHSFYAPSTILSAITRRLTSISLALPSCYPSVRGVLGYALAPGVRDEALSKNRLRVSKFYAIGIVCIRDVGGDIHYYRRDIGFSRGFSMGSTPSGPIVVAGAGPRCVGYETLDPHELIVRKTFSLCTGMFSGARADVFAPSSGVRASQGAIAYTSLGSFYRRRFSIYRRVSMNRGPRVRSILHDSMDIKIVSTGTMAKGLVLGNRLGLGLLCLSGTRDKRIRGLSCLLPFGGVLSYSKVSRGAVGYISYSIVSCSVELGGSVLSRGPSIVLRIGLYIARRNCVAHRRRVMYSTCSARFSSLPRFRRLGVANRIIPVGRPRVRGVSIGVSSKGVSQVLSVFARRVATRTSRSSENVIVDKGVGVYVLTLGKRSVPIFVRHSTSCRRVVPRASYAYTGVFNAEATDVDCELTRSSIVRVHYRLGVYNTIFSRGEMGAMGGMGIFRSGPVPPRGYTLALCFTSGKRGL